jgi:predicted MFS family arabinose efflux permease
MILGPTLGAKYGVDKLFLLTALLSLISLALLIKVPNPPKIIHHKSSSSIKEIFQNSDLIKLFFSGFMQKGLMSLYFLLTPIIFTKYFGWEKAHLWKVYIPALIFGFFALPLGAILAEKKAKGKLVFIISASSITFSLFLFLIAIYLKSSIIALISVIIFFFGFNLLEPVLQSFVSKVAKAHQKATALSISNTIQYLGIFLGGSVGGFFLKKGYLNEFLAFAILVGLVWIYLLVKMKPIKKFKIVEYENFDDTFIDELKTEKNVYDYYIKDGKLIVRYI